MVGGQVVDVESEKSDDCPITREKLDFIYRLKTGALIESSMMIGAILAGASSDEVSRVEQIAAKLGLAFQIQDDVLDVTSTLEVLGKPVGSDEKIIKRHMSHLRDWIKRFLMWSASPRRQRSSLMIWDTMMHFLRSYLNI